MNFINLFKISYKALLRNKTRALLTMLGIIIGIGSVIAMVSLGQSSSKSINDQISTMGTNLITVLRNFQRQGGVNIGAGSVQTLTEKDVEAMLQKSKNIMMATPVVRTSAQLVYGSNNWPGSLQGGNSDFLAISKLEIERGTNFTEANVRSAAKVCVIGQTVVETCSPTAKTLSGKISGWGKYRLKSSESSKARGKTKWGKTRTILCLRPTPPSNSAFWQSIMCTRYWLRQCPKAKPMRRLATSPPF
jgi:putative ABC transport system permease protein